MEWKDKGTCWPHLRGEHLWGEGSLESVLPLFEKMPGGCHGSGQWQEEEPSGCHHWLRPGSPQTL